MKADSRTEATAGDPGPEPRRLMLLGKSGAGKSSSGNTILNKKVFKSDMRLARVTILCQKEGGMVEDTPITVIDTPGFFEKERNEEDIIREILQRVKLQEPGPHVFVFVVNLGRMTQEDQDTNALIEAMFGPRVWDYTIVLFTHGDSLEGKTINDVISESDDNLRNFIRKCSGGFHVFNNKKPEDQKQVMSFMEKIQTLVALNGGGHYETKMYPEEERKIRERQECILKEKNNNISNREKALREHHEGDDLKAEITKLWREEEEIARKLAEKVTIRKSYWMNILRGLLCLVLMCILVECALRVPGMVQLVTLVICTGALFIIFPAPQNISWPPKKTKGAVR